MNYEPSYALPEGDTWVDDSGAYPPYLFTEDIAIAVDVALATGRPLLIAGPPGSGKSTLAAAMAGLLGRRYLRHTLTSRTRLEELTAELDHLRRLRDAEAGATLAEDWAYLKPGLLWWAFDPAGAGQRGSTPDERAALPENFSLPAAKPPGTARFVNGNPVDAVILLDEIDKAEPDLPNDLLEPLDLKRFSIPGRPVVEAGEKLKLLVIITTNGERELPPAFLRRCVSLVLKHPDPDRLVDIGRHHYPNTADETLLKTLATKLQSLRSQAREKGIRPPGTSEYIDTVAAISELEIGLEHPLWEKLEQTTLLKHVPWSEDEED